MEGFDVAAVVEEEAREVDVPGASPEPLNPNVVSLLKQKEVGGDIGADVSEGRRCEEWVRDVVDRLVERGFLKGQARRCWMRRRGGR